MPPKAKLPRKARAVVFDMDGLIFNTEAIYRDAIMAVAADGGHDIPLHFYLSTIGMSGEATRIAFTKSSAGRSSISTCSGRQQRSNFTR